MIRKSLLIFLIFNFISFSSKALQQVCADGEIKNTFVIESVAKDLEATFLQRSQMIKSNRIELSQANDANPIFQKKPLLPGDCLTYRQSEKYQSMDVVTESTKALKANLFPAFLLRAKDQSQHFVLIEESVLQKLKPKPLQETPFETILNYQTKESFTVIYVLCSQDRDEMCDVRFKKQGKWVLDKNNQPLEFKTLSRSRKRSQNSQSQRVKPWQDTPEGIYKVWGSVFTDTLHYGVLPRIDLDARKKPLLAGMKIQNLKTLQGLVPKDAFDDYWIHEWALAFHMGRADFRFHGNSVNPKHIPKYKTPKGYGPFMPNRGCLNMGEPKDNKKFLEALVELGILQNDVFSVKDEWRDIANPGQVFVIVKDRD